MVSPAKTVNGVADHSVTMAEPVQKGTVRGAKLITASPQRKPKPSAGSTVTPQKNDRAQGNEKRMKGGLKKRLATNNEKKSEEVQFLRMKQKLMSKAAVTAMKAAKKPNPETKTTAAAAKDDGCQQEN